MISNYLKTSFRNLKKRLPFTLVNIIGLSIGLSCFLLLIAYTNYEENYEDFQDNKEQLYRIVFERFQGDELKSSSPAVMPSLGYKIKGEIPEVKQMSRFSNGSGIVKSIRVTAEEEKIYYADADFFKMFSFPLEVGNPDTVLENPNSIVLTESSALKYFGKEEAVGKELEVANEFGTAKYYVTGIVKDLPLNTSFSFDFLCSFNSINKGKNWFVNNWMWWSFPTYVTISNKADLESVKKQFPAFIKKYKTDPIEASVTWNFSFQPIEDIHLKSDFRNETVRRDTKARTLNLLKIIAFLILVISWVNYINLSTASSTERAKEIGVRKSLGAYKSQISKQFLTEAALVNIIAAILSIIIIIMIIKPFSKLLGLNYSTEILLQPTFWVYLLPIIIVGIIVSGLYPAFILASFKSTEVLKTKTMSTPGSVMVRKVLVGIQFVISIILITCTCIMINQNNFMKNKDLGVDIDKIIVIKKPQLLEKKVYKSQINSFIKELHKGTNAKYTTASFALPSIESWGLAVWKSSEDPGTQKVHMVNGVDANYIPTFGLKLLAGRNFDENRISDENAVIISRKSLKILGIEDPNDAINVSLNIETFEDRLFNIIGVIDDFHHNSLKSEIGGMILTPNTGLFSPPRYFSLKLDNNKVLKNTIGDAKSIYKQFFPEDLFEYYILNDKYQLQYVEEDRNQNVFTVFSFLAIFLACIGILGLSSFIAFLKTRDIAIRKVFGADKDIILWVLSKEFLYVLIGASCIAIPIVIYFMKDWLADFPYRIEISFWHFAIAIFSIFFITLLVIGVNLYKSLKRKPIQSLRSE
ncbi:ABC transporter permease [Flavobacterium daejeonense]|uniref:ABC transporter permease n=1 Tax=Flavobacterium daejeonense TaxID=350893 RepID=UPI00047C0CE2|nr:ABC transporter permease [Flavobacterium daejeonense]